MVLDKLWYGKHSILTCMLACCLFPFNLAFTFISASRRLCYQKGLLASSAPAVPVVVVGGITVGGSGKTPLCHALVHFLYEQGYKPGIISRGYKGKAEHYPLIVSEDSDPIECGDEPLLLKRMLKNEATIVVDPIRNRGAKYLADLGVDVIVTDDGMQHYALKRDVEICVLDAQRMMGNGHLLPLGPLREGKERLKLVDAVVINGGHEHLADYFSMQLQPLPPRSLNPGNITTLPRGTEVYALAGIGNPERFYQTVENLGLKIIKTISVPDHGKLGITELEQYALRHPVVMTTKDAIKYNPEQIDNIFVIQIKAMLDPLFYKKILERINNSAHSISLREEHQDATSANPK